MKPASFAVRSGGMSRLLVLLLTAAALAAPATAVAAPPWSAPATIPGALGSSTPIVVTPAGTAVLLAPISRTAAGSSGGPPSELVPLAADGQPGTAQPVAIAAGLLTTYAGTMSPSPARRSSTARSPTAAIRRSRSAPLAASSEPRTASAPAPAST